MELMAQKFERGAKVGGKAELEEEKASSPSVTRLPGSKFADSKKVAHSAVSLLTSIPRSRLFADSISAETS